MRLMMNIGWWGRVQMPGLLLFQCGYCTKIHFWKFYDTIESVVKLKSYLEKMIKVGIWGWTDWKRIGASPSECKSDSDMKNDELIISPHYDIRKSRHDDMMTGWHDQSERCSDSHWIKASPGMQMSLGAVSSSSSPSKSLLSPSLSFPSPLASSAK